MDEENVELLIEMAFGDHEPMAPCGVTIEPHLSRDWRLIVETSSVDELAAMWVDRDGLLARWRVIRMRNRAGGDVVIRVEMRHMPDSGQVEVLRADDVAHAFAMVAVAIHEGGWDVVADPVW